MKAAQKLKKEMLIKFGEYNKGVFSHGPLDTDEQVIDAWDKFVASSNHWDTVSEFRGGQIETDLPSYSDRNYEAKEVAAKMSDGSWLGWTYWYGGGKYGNPEEIEWISEAYNLDCVEEQKVVTVRTFKKV